MTTAATTRRRRRGLGIRSVLLLAVLAPLLGLVMGGFATGREARDQRDVARRAQDEVHALARIVDTRIAVEEAFAQVAIAAFADDLGLDIDRLSELSGTDCRAALAAARRGVDADPVFASAPELAGARRGSGPDREAPARGRCCVRDVRRRARPGLRAASGGG